MEKYNKEAYGYVVVNKNAIGEIVNIEILPDAPINEAIRDAINYLYSKKDTKSYICIYRRSRFKINAKSDAARLTNYFMEHYNHVTEELSIN